MDALRSGWWSRHLHGYQYPGGANQRSAWAAFAEAAASRPGGQRMNAYLLLALAIASEVMGALSRL